MLLELKEVTIPTLDQKCVIINEVSFGIKEGSIHAIIGPNGSGKSTLAYAIMGLGNYKVLHGKILFDGFDITNLSITERAKLGITLAWQEPARIDGLSVYRYITLGLKDTTKMREKVVEALNIVNLEPEKYINRKIDESLSGGERKRVELAAAIAMEPRLIILDEPDSGLDFIVLEDFMNIFEKIKRLNMTILLITHREDIGMVADYGTLLWRGDHIITDVFPKVMLRYCAKAGLKEFCKRTLFKDGAICFDDEYIDRIFREEGVS
ncbi:MAG: ATP-binding cassette domain-containing protein [Candidatus Lokiarchaeota archaeon]|nr:ATP-binding cassette domain-containing protein [Candidatus Lokiarchaeota archaeon]